MGIARFSEETTRILKLGGWYQDRHVAYQLEPELAPLCFPKAAEFLSEFWGLHVGDHGPGITCARTDIEINSNLAVDLIEEFKSFGNDKRNALFPLGAMSRGYTLIFLSNDGRVYAFIKDFIVLAPTLDEAIEHILLGMLGI